MLQLALGRKEVPRVLARDGPFLRRVMAYELDHQSEVILITRILLARARVEKEVPGDELKKHARGTPDVSSLVPMRANDDLWRPVLPRLDLVRNLAIGLTA